MAIANGPTSVGFSFDVRKAGDVAIRRDGRVVTVLRGAVAREFLAKVTGRSPGDVQLAMARATGNYKRGNESAAVGHRRNRRPGTG